MANPFLESQEGDNPFLEKNLPNPNGAAVVQAGQYTADGLATAQRQSKGLGVPADVLARNPEQAAQMELRQNLDGVRERNPALADWLADPKRLALARDDLDGLEKLAGSLASGEPSWQDNLLGDIAVTGMGLYRNVSRFARGQGTFQDAEGMADSARSVPAGAARGIGATVGGFGELYNLGERTTQRGLDAIGLDFRFNREDVPIFLRPGDSFIGTGQQIKGGADVVGVPQERQDTITGIAEGVGQLGALAVQSIVAPQTIPATTFAMGADEMAGSVREAGAYGTGRGDVAIGTGSAVIGALERLGLEGVVNRLPPRIRDPFYRYLADAALSGLAEGGTESMQQVAQNAIIQQTVDGDQSLTEGVLDSGVQGAGAATIVRALLGLPGVPRSQTRRAAEDLRRILTSADANARLQAQGNIAAELGLATASPDDLAAFVAQVAGEDATVYLPAEQARVLFQSDDALLNLVGDADTLAEQMAAGELSIPLSRWLTTVPQLPNRAEIERQARTSTDGMSPAEMEDFNADTIAGDLGDAGRAEPGEPTSRQRIEHDVAGQLVGTGRYTPAQAETQARIWGAAFTRFGAMTGQDPAALFERYMAGIRSGQNDPRNTRRWMGGAKLDSLIDSIRNPDSGASANQVFGPSLASWLVGQGGIQEEGGELRARDAGRIRPGLVNRRGLAMDRARELAVEAGYLPDGADLNDFIDALDADLKGSPVYSDLEGNQERQAFEAEREDLLRAIEDNPTLRDMPAEEFAALTNQQIAEALFGSHGFDQSAAPQTTTTQDPAAGGVSASGPRTLFQRAGDAVRSLFQSDKPQTETAAFKRWFGDSKVVDAAGNPLVVYHATDADFDTFVSQPNSDIGFHFGSEDAASERADQLRDGIARRWNNGREKTLQVYLSIKNPLRVSDYSFFSISDPKAEDDNLIWELREAGIDVVPGMSNREAIRAIEAAGYDGLVYENIWEGGGDSWAAFRPEQIKSATANSGAFDRSNPSILNQRRSESAPRGQIEIFPDRRMAISLFEKADRSTFLHESGHFFLEVFRDIAAMPDAPQQVKDDFAALLSWMGVESADQIGTEQHEMFARAFELYLAEGKAPSPELQSVFSQFKAWLIGIYRTLRNLNVELTDDVRGVMDRMLASEEEIEAAQARTGWAPIARDAAEAGALGLSEQQFADYQAMVAAAAEEARAEVMAKLEAGHRRERAVWWKEETAQVRGEVEAEYGWAPIEQAARVLAGAQTLPDGSPMPEALAGMKLSREALVQVYGEAYLKRLRGLYSKSGGVDQDAAAMALGFTSGDALLAALANRADTRARIEAETDARMRERHGDPQADLPQSALDAVHNTQRVKVLERELGMLADLAGQPRPNARAIREAARQITARKTSRQLRPSEHLAAERRAANAATKAAAAGDYAAALLAKRQQAFAAALYRAARDAQERSEATIRYLRRAASDKTRQRVGKQAGKHYVDALDAIFAGHEVGQVSGREVARRASLRDWVRREQEAGANTAVTEDLLARVEAENVTNVADLTIEQLEQMREAVENLLHLARVKDRLLTAKGAREWAEVKAELIERLEGQAQRHGRTGISAADRSALDRVGDLYAAGANWVLQPETVIEWLDGGTSGPFHDALWEMSEAAEHTRERLNRMVGEKLQAALDALPKVERQALDRRFRIDSLDAEVSGHSILSALLNMGTAKNRDKLLRGGRVVGDGIVPFTETQLAEMFSKLSRPQADLVQEVWDAVGLLWPEIVRQEEDLNGIAPEPRPPIPFTVITRDGPVALRGGYYTIMYDPAGARAGRFAEDEQAQRAISGQTPIRASTSKGHLEKVTDYVAPLLLDYQAVLSRHLDGVMSDIAYRQFLQQVYKVLGDAEIARMIDNRVGPGAARGLQKSFERGAVGNFSLAPPYFGPWQKAADATMTNLSSAALGFRVPLALANVVTAPILATARVKPKYLAAGLADYYLGSGPNFVRNMRTHAEAIQRLSPMMVKRAEGRSVELQAIINDLRGKTGFRAKMIELAMAVHQWIVPLAENAIWLGAYKQAQAGGADITESARMADKAIRQTQTKHTAKDLSAAEGSIMRPLMMFAGPLVIINNRLQEAGLRGLRGDVQSRTQALGVWLAMAAGGALLFELMMGRGPGDEDEDGDEDVADWIRWLAVKTAILPFQALPVLREVAAYADDGYTRPNPLVDAGTALVKFGKEAGEQVFGDEDLDSEKLSKAAIRAAGVSYGVPSNQLIRSGSDLMSIAVDGRDLENPAAEAYYLMQGPPADE